VSTIASAGAAAAPEPGLEFELPAALLAGEPPEARGLPRAGARMMVSRGRAWPVPGELGELPGHLRPGDLVVVNTSSTLAAVLTARRPDGREAVVRLATPLGLDGPWVVELPVAPDQDDHPWPSEAWVLPGQGHLHMLGPYRGSWRLWLVDVRVPAPLPTYLAEHGRPLRPDGVSVDWPLDVYRTCFAREPGSTAMASAGRAFTPELLTSLVSSGVVVAPLLLHTCGVVGEDGAPLPEPYHVPPVTARLVNHTRASGGRVVAVGTTVARALETVAAANGVVRPARGWSDLVVTPERGVRVVDGLLTGWHEPGGSHLRLLEAVAGPEPLALAYRAAIEHGFAWGTFGDLHLILPGTRRRGRRAPAHR
jgi:S-adenosylmethionine:tRNA ribosyltransferase-isomerase